MLKKTLVHILTSEQQKQAVERIQTLISSGRSSGEAIIQVARELRAHNIGDKIFIDE